MKRNLLWVALSTYPFEYRLPSCRTFVQTDKLGLTVGRPQSDQTIVHHCWTKRSKAKVQIAQQGQKSVVVVELLLLPVLTTVPVDGLCSCHHPPTTHKRFKIRPSWRQAHTFRTVGFRRALESGLNTHARIVACLCCPLGQS
jgi:hypothetical protein